MNSNSLVRDILGPRKGSIRLFISAIDVAADLIFVKRMAEEDVRLGADICGQVAELYGAKEKSVLRTVERWGNCSWDTVLKNGLMMKYIGKVIKIPEEPRKIVIYLATYAYFGKPYHEMVLKHPEMFSGKKYILK